MARRVARSLVAGAVAALAGLSLAACGSSGAGSGSSLDWYINPDAGGQAEIAARCSEESGGSYSIRTILLPRDAPGQREQLIRRLAAGDDSIDLMSLDPPFIPEFAEAGFLAEIPGDVQQAVSEGVVDGALTGATWKDELVTVPFWANTQLLWYRQSVAEAAGLDMEGPVTWDQLIEAAEQQGKTFAVQGARAESLTVWINGLVASAGGEILENPEADPRDLQLGIESEAGAEAARIMRAVADAGIGGPALPTSTEDDGASLFESDDTGGFMVNYPFIWPRGLGAVEGGTLEQASLDDYGWALWPQVTEGEPSRPPYGGINLGVSSLSPDTEAAYEAAQCIVSQENQTEYFVTNGNPAALAAVYDDPEVQEAFPMADVIRESLENAAPRPQTGYYNEISTGLQRTWHPPGSVDPESSPADADGLITSVLRGESLL